MSLHPLLAQSCHAALKKKYLCVMSPAHVIVNHAVLCEHRSALAWICQKEFSARLAQFNPSCVVGLSQSSSSCSCAREVEHVPAQTVFETASCAEGAAACQFLL